MSYAVLILTFMHVLHHQDNKRDPFVVYGSDYVKVRDAVAGAIYGNLVKELSEVVKVIHKY